MMKYKTLIKFIFVISLFTTTYLVYYLFVGIPKTQARNLYEAAQEFKQINRYDKYLENLQKAYNSWPEIYISDEIEIYKEILRTED